MTKLLTAPENSQVGVYPFPGRRDSKKGSSAPAVRRGSLT